MSQKRRETMEATRNQISEIEARQHEKAEDISDLQEKLASITSSINQLQEKAVQFESVPKMLSVKRRQTEESFQMKNVENDMELVSLHKSVLGMLEHMAAFEKRISTLESRRSRGPCCFAVCS